MKWFALASGFVVVAVPLSLALWAVTPLVPLPAIALTVWPISASRSCATGSTTWTW